MLIGFEVHTIARVMMMWIFLIAVILCTSVSGNSNAKFFRMGPHDDLMLFGVSINNGWRYTSVFLYTCISTIVRTLQQEVLRPWIIQQIQNSKPKDSYALQHAYFVVGVETIFIWFDWFMYINILLSQVDLMLVEMAGNLLAVFYTTRIYIHSSAPMLIS